MLEDLKGERNEKKKFQGTNKMFYYDFNGNSTYGWMCG